MLAQRTLGALRLTRSFLLLEDDYDVDWEVDLEANGSLTQLDHPHRRTLRGPDGRSRRAHKRRAGETVPATAVCLSPVDGPTRSRLEVLDGPAPERRDTRHSRSEARA
jgi:hypothetical protein